MSFDQSNALCSIGVHTCGGVPNSAIAIGKYGTQFSDYIASFAMKDQGKDPSNSSAFKWTGLKFVTIPPRPKDPNRDFQPPPAPVDNVESSARQEDHSLDSNLGNADRLPNQNGPGVPTYGGSEPAVPAGLDIDVLGDILKKILPADAIEAATKRVGNSGSDLTGQIPE